MKNNNFILLVLISILYFNCRAQTPILPKYGNPDYGDVENAYYKDTEGFNNQFVGTWIYTEGNTSLKLVFQNKTMIHVTGAFGNFYTDVLIGEYQYFENGIEKINTLPNLNVNHENYWNYNLHLMSRIRPNAFPKCLECSLNEYRLNLELHEPTTRDILGLDNCFAIRRYFDNGVEKLKVWFVKTDNGVYVDKNTEEIVIFNGYSLPFGEYVLIKQ